MAPSSTILQWLNGIEPAWHLLDPATVDVLRRPSAAFGSILMAMDLTEEETARSAAARTALGMLHAATPAPGLKLTAQGNLSRAVVGKLCEELDWPGFDTAELYRYYKAFNEADVYPLVLVREFLSVLKLVRRSKGHLLTTPAGRRIVRQAEQGAVQAMLFHTAFWFCDLAYSQPEHYDFWPSNDIGVVLWSLSIAAHDWLSRERLTRLCTIPNDGLFDRGGDTPGYQADSRIFKPLTWFGLLETRESEIEPGRYVGTRYYRKTPLFDRFLSFDVPVPVSPGSRH